MDVLCSQRGEVEMLRHSKQKAAGMRVPSQEFIGKVLPPGVGTAACRDNLQSSRPEEVWNKGMMKFSVYRQIPQSESLLESSS